MTSDPFELTLLTLTLHVLIKTDWLFTYLFNYSNIVWVFWFIFKCPIHISWAYLKGFSWWLCSISYKKKVYWFLSRDCHIILTPLMWSQIMSVSFVTTYFEQHFEMMIIGEFSKMSKSSWWRQFTAISWRMCYWNENNVNPRNCASCQTVFIRKYLLNFIYVYLYKSVFF